MAVPSRGVAADFAGGTVEHALVPHPVCKMVGHPGAAFRAVIISARGAHAGGELSAGDAANLSALRAELGKRLVGEIPPLEPNAGVPTDAIDFDVVTRQFTAS